MNAPEHLTDLSQDALLALVAEQYQQISAQQRQIAELIARVETLHAEVERLRRGAKRQAAPFSKGTRVAEPKRPGRKPGSGPFRYRDAPPPEALTTPAVDVKVRLDGCPTCGGPLAEERVDFVYTTELPPRPQPQVTPYRVWVCRCTVWGPQVRGQHPAVAPDQIGATAHRVGPRVMAAAQAWHDGVGIPGRQVPLVMAALTGVQLTQGALTQDALRRAAGPVGIAYEQLRAVVQEAPVVHTDDTGWRIGGNPAHLMAFETDLATVYQIRPRHRHQEVQEVIPADDGGVMVTDRGRSDDAPAFDRVEQQKCPAPLPLHDIVERKRGRAREFGASLKTVLQDALALWHRHREEPVADFKVEGEARQAELTYQLRDRRLNDRDHQRLLNELGWHHDRGNVLRFLVEPRIEPTNHRAERALRPAVIARQVSHCSKNDAGAYAFAAITSVVRTLAKQGVDSLVENLYQLFRCPDVQATPP